MRLFMLKLMMRRFCASAQRTSFTLPDHKKGTARARLEELRAMAIVTDHNEANAVRALRIPSRTRQCSQPCGKPCIKPCFDDKGHFFHWNLQSRPHR